jgi:hypothetical protein
MKGGHWLIFLLVMSAAYPQTVPTTERPTESQHRRGPDGLEGWTLSYAIPGHASDRYPEALVIARHGIGSSGRKGARLPMRQGRFTSACYALLLTWQPGASWPVTTAFMSYPPMHLSGRKHFRPHCDRLTIASFELLENS